MAEELRGTQYHDTSTTTFNGTKILENTADKDMYIRGVHVAEGVAATDANAMILEGQIGKNNAFSSTDADSGVKMQWKNMPPVQAGTSQGVVNKSWLFAKGQLTLEPGESLYLNEKITATGAPDVKNCTLDIHYHY